MLHLFDYRTLYADANVRTLMRQVDDPVVMTGRLFQSLRGLLFALAFYPFRQTLFGQPRDWLLIALRLLVLDVFNTFGPAPGSIEGLIYTVLPVRFQLTGLPEVLIQALLFSFILHYWGNHPNAKWLNWTLGTVFTMIIGLVVLGLFATNGKA